MKRKPKKDISGYGIAVLLVGGTLYWCLPEGSILSLLGTFIMFIGAVMFLFGL